MNKNRGNNQKNSTIGNKAPRSRGKRDNSDIPSLVKLFDTRPPGVVSPTVFAIYILSVFAIAGVSHMAGSPFFVTLALVLLGFSLTAITIRLLMAERKLSHFVGRNVARSREEFEAIADRMWELQESEERFRGLIDALGDIVVHRDQDGRIAYANSVFVKLIGSTASGVRGKTLGELGIKVGKLPDASLFSDELLTSQDVAIHTGDDTRWYSWIELSARDEGTGAVSHRAIARDITPRKKAEREMIEAREKAELASQAKSRFLATVSHEIRTPMNGILGMAKLLADTGISPEQRTYITSVITSADALMTLIEDLLDFSKIEAGRMELNPVSIAPHGLIESVVELLASRAFAKGIGIGCFIDNAVPGQIAADPGRLRQVLINLIGNAIKFTDKGGVLVRARMGRKRSHPQMRISVEDTGPGLNRSDKKRIFEEFEQADSTSTREHGGAGLGLAISKKIVEAMGGELTVRARKGGGSIFTVTVPVRDAKTEQRADANPLTASNVLIVSNNDMEAEAIAGIIETAGGSSARAGSIAAARSIVAAKKADYNAILVDSSLETPSGRAIRKICKAGFTGERVVALIAPTDRGRLPQLFNAGYTSFLARPVRGNSLIRQLSAALGPDAEPEDAARDGTPATGNSRGIPTMNILLAEDNPINATLARAVLEKAGHRVTIVEDGLSAAQLCASEKSSFDLVLMDLHMPVMDGLDAIAAIRAREEETGRRQLPILVLTADGQEGTETSVFARGANGFLTKPLDPASLISTVENKAA